MQKIGAFALGRHTVMAGVITAMSSLSAQAASIDYTFTGIVSAFSPTYAGETYSAEAIVDTTLQSVTSFNFVVGGDKTWAGSGGLAFYDPTGTGLFVLSVRPDDGSTYSQIADGFTPEIAELSLIEGNPGNGGATDFLYGFPTTFSLSVGFDSFTFSGNSGQTNFNGQLSTANGTSAEPIPLPATATLVLAGFLAGASLGHLRPKPSRRREREQLLLLPCDETSNECTSPSACCRAAAEAQR